MNTLLKVVAAVVAVVVVLLVALAAWVALIFDPNDFRPMLVNAVERNTGRSLQIEGDLDLSLFPCCSVTVGPSVLGNPPDFPDEPFARVAEADLSLRLWPLLMRREVQIGTVTVDGLDLALVRLADGRVNWEFVEPRDEPEPDPAAGPLDGLSIAGLRLRDARVAYRDLQAGQAYTASQVNVRTGAIAADVPFPFESSATVTDDADGTEARLSAAGTLTIGDERLEVRDPRVEVTASGPAVPARQAQARIQGRALDLTFADATALATEALSVTFEVTGLEAVAADVAGRLGAERLQMNLDALRGEVSALTFQAQGLDARAHGTGAGTFGADDASLRGTIELERAVPHRLLAALGGDYRPTGPNALSRLSGNAAWSVVGERLALQDLNFLLDDTRLTGSATLEGFGAGAVRLDLRLDRLDVDRYLPEPAVAAATTPPEPTRIPLGELAGLDLDTRLRIDTLQAGGVPVSDVRMTLTSRRGTTAVRLEGAGMGGNFQIDGGGNVAAADPQLTGSVTVREVSPRALLTAVGAPPETSDPDALAVLSGTAQWRLGTGSAALQNIAWQLDETRITGSLGVDDLDRLATRFDLSVDRMDLDRYLAPAQDGAPDDEETRIPVELLRELDLNGQLRAGRLTVFRLPLENLQLQAQSSAGVLRLDPLRAGLFGGEYRGAVTVDATGARPVISVDQQISAVQVGELLRTWYDTDRINGALSLSLSGRGSGATVTDVLRTLAGDLSMNLSDGAYRGMDLLHEVRQARAALRAERLPAAPEEKITPLRALSLRGRVVDGVLTSDTLSAETDVLRLSGRGGFDLADLTFDWRLNAQVQRDADVLRELVGVTLPITIQGPVMSPQVRVDLSGAAAGALRDRVEDRAREALQRRLGNDRDEAAGGEAPPAPADPDAAPAEPDAPAEPEPAAEPQPERRDDSPRDLLRRGLRDLIKPPPD